MLINSFLNAIKIFKGEKKIATIPVFLYLNLVSGETPEKTGSAVA
jgi:hypothetical protein